jgi:4-amino-4-deoxy-L-arabinose transferase-like glycosyltransferase
MIIQKLLNTYQRYWFPLLVVILIVFAISGMGITLWATSKMGIGIRSDSVAYIWSARSLASGLGLGRPDGLGNFKPMTHWPPFYPLLLTGFELVGVDAIEGARWLGAFLIGLNVFLFGWLISRITRSFWFSLFGSFILLVSPAIWETSQMAMTEPLYIALSLLGFILIDFYFEKNRYKYLWAAAGIISLAFLTRYVGLSLVLTICVVLILRGKSPFKIRLRDAALFFIISIMPIVIWIFRNLLVSGSTTNRNLAYFPISSSDFSLIVETLQGWIVPLKTVFYIGEGKIMLSFLALLFLVLFARFLPKQKDQKYDLPLSVFLYGFFYVVMLFVTRLFFDPALTIFEQRILTPVFVSGLFLLIYLSYLLWEKARVGYLPFAAILTILFVWAGYTFGLLYFTQTKIDVSKFYNLGGGFAQKDLAHSDLVKELQQLPNRGVVFTTNIEEFYYYTGRRSFGYSVNEFKPEFIAYVNQLEKGQGVIFLNFYDSSDLESLIENSFPWVNKIYDIVGATIYSGLN